MSIKADHVAGDPDLPGSFNGLATEVNRLTSLTRSLVSVKDYFAAGDGVSDDSTAFATAIAAAAGVSKCFVPAGIYVLSNVELLTGIHLYGVRGKSILKFASGADHLLGVRTTGAGGSSSTSTNIRAITLEDLVLVGRVVEDGFSEHKHLLSLNGVSDVGVDGCQFSAWQGDAVYLGSGVAVERHNEDVRITNCQFDGVNKNNRQGISVIDCARLTISDNTFANCTRTDMPGAVDVEPDATWSVLADIEISNNEYRNVGGNTGTITFAWMSGMATEPRRIKIKDNLISGSHHGITLTVSNAHPIASGAEHNDVLIQGNQIEDGIAASRPFWLTQLRGVTVCDNIVRNYPYSNQLYDVVDVTFTGNTYVDCSTTQDNIFLVYAAENLTVEAETVINSAQNVTFGNLIQLNDGGAVMTSSGLKVVNNRAFGAITKLIAKSANHVTDATTNEMWGNYGFTTQPPASIAVTTQPSGGDIHRVDLGQFQMQFGSSANEKKDFYFPAPFWGILELELLGGFNATSNVGSILKRYTVALAASGTIYINESRTIACSSNAAAEWSLGDITWDATNSRYRVQIGHQTTNVNRCALRVSTYCLEDSGGNLLGADSMKTAAISATYTTDATVLSSGPSSYSGTGTPEGAVKAAIGSTYQRSNGGASTSLYVKESGTGNTGWVAK